MENSISRVLIETIVKKTLRDMKDDPERSIRNLVDRALLVSKGRFQKRFFQTAQSMLHNQQSAYYDLVRNVVENVDHARLMGFGMNVGYNSCTAGAKKIREIEAKEGFNIPWAMFLEIDAASFAQHCERYAALIDEGKALGIYTWFFRTNGFTVELFQLMEQHPDCAFGLLCPPDDMSRAFIEEAEHLNNLMLGVAVNEKDEEICAELRERNLLYCIYFPYNDEGLDEILSDNLLHDTQSLNAPFSVYMPKKGCSKEAQAKAFDYVLRIRNEQRFPTIPWELFQDNMAVDTTISDDGCSAGFWADGSFFTVAGQKEQCNLTLHEHTLKDILKACLAK